MIQDINNNQSVKSGPKRKDRLSSYTARFRLRNTLDAIDIFRKPLPNFNMRGRTSVPTVCGAIVTFTIIISYIKHDIASNMTVHDVTS